MFRRVIASLLLTWTFAVGAIAQPATVRVAAAASIKPALDEIVATYAARTGIRVEAVYGASGNLRRQIVQGAPFDLFLSADEETALALAKDGHAVDNGTIYAQGELVVFAPNGGVFTPDAVLQGLSTAIAAGRITRFAIASPEHAPYGKAAEQALRKAGLWDQIKPVLVTGENVAQAAQFAISGSTQGGLFARSLALTDAVRAAGTVAVLPAGSHDPINQRMVLLKRGGAEARAFFNDLSGKEAGAAFARHGLAPASRQD